MECFSNFIPPLFLFIEFNLIQICRCKIIKFSQPRFPQPLGKRSFDNSAIYNSARGKFKIRIR